jgi:hypothetical protein
VGTGNTAITTTEDPTLHRLTTQLFDAPTWWR